jgi:hypothetical protein
MEGCELNIFDLGDGDRAIFWYKIGQKHQKILCTNCWPRDQEFNAPCCKELSAKEILTSYLSERTRVRRAAARYRDGNGRRFDGRFSHPETSDGTGRATGRPWRP